MFDGLDFQRVRVQPQVQPQVQPRVQPQAQTQPQQTVDAGAGGDHSYMLA